MNSITPSSAASTPSSLLTTGGSPSVCTAADRWRSTGRSSPSSEFFAIPEIRDGKGNRSSPLLPGCGGASETPQAVAHHAHSARQARCLGHDWRRPVDDGSVTRRFRASRHEMPAAAGKRGGRRPRRSARTQRRRAKDRDHGAPHRRTRNLDRMSGPTGDCVSLSNAAWASWYRRARYGDVSIGMTFV